MIIVVHFDLGCFLSKAKLARKMRNVDRKILIMKSGIIFDSCITLIIHICTSSHVTFSDDTAHASEVRYDMYYIGRHEPSRLRFLEMGADNHYQSAGLTSAKSTRFNNVMVHRGACLLATLLDTRISHKYAVNMSDVEESSEPRPNR